MGQSIPPVTRMGMARGTWVTVLCRKLRDWWHWVCLPNYNMRFSYPTNIILAFLSFYQIVLEHKYFAVTFLEVSFIHQSSVLGTSC
jgi:hypothetical protein